MDGSEDHLVTPEAFPEEYHLLLKESQLPESYLEESLAEHQQAKKTYAKWMTRSTGKLVVLPQRQTQWQLRSHNIMTVTALDLTGSVNLVPVQAVTATKECMISGV